MSSYKQKVQKICHIEIQLQQELRKGNLWKMVVLPILTKAAYDPSVTEN